MLVVDPGRVIPADYLVDALWGGAAPPGASTTLRSYMSRLRTALAAGAALVAQGGGYALMADPSQIDAARFEALVKSGNDGLSTGDPAAANRFAEALALWRGPALAGVTEVEPLAREAARLEEIRLAAAEGRAESELALGRHAEVIGELERLVGEHPLRERLWRLLVLALYRAERQADALAACRRARDLLARELGVDPGAELRELEQAVLQHQVPPVPPPARDNLPAALTSFVGRQDDLSQLSHLTGQARLVTLTGTGGTGKTRLALELAARVVDRFADGVWLVDLSGTADPALVPSAVMRTLGVRQSAGVPVIDALRYRLRSADLLLLLDNCEHLLDACADIADSLLAGSRGLRILATSREPLGIPGENVHPVLPLALSSDLRGEIPISEAAAERLFLDRVAAVRPGPGQAPPGVVARICRQLDGLPLAIELAAARAGTFSVEEIETYLTDKFRFLAYRRPAADPRHQTLRAAFTWSYDLLADGERRLFRTLAVFAGGFALESVAAVCDAGRPGLVDAIDALVAKSLVVAEPAGGRTRYRLLETIREYATTLLDKAGETEPARRRHAEAFLQLARREPDPTVLHTDHDNFRAALDWSLGHSDQAGPELAVALGAFWLANGLFQEALAWLERALATDPHDLPVRADLLRLLGTVLTENGQLERAREVLTDAAELAAATGLKILQARIAILLANISGTLHPSADVLQDCRRAAAVLESAGDTAALAEAWLQIGQQLFYLGDSPADQDAFERAAAYAQQSGNQRARDESSKWLVVGSALLPVPADLALRRAEQLLADAAGNPRAEANILQAIPPLYAYLGRLTEARAAVTRSQAHHSRSGAQFDWALTAIFSGGEVEMIAGDLVAAERHLSAGIAVLRAGGALGFLSSALPRLAEVLYAQDRLAEAWPLTEESEAIASPDDSDAEAEWRSIRAKLLARRGDFAAACRLADEAVALPAPTHNAIGLVRALTARAEVFRLAGRPDDAASSLRRAAELLEDRHATFLAQQTRAALARLEPQHGSS